MNHTKQYNEQKYTPQFGGNSVTESESPITLLFECYLEAGLRPESAWDAALADYSHSFNGAV